MDVENTGSSLRPLLTPRDGIPEPIDTAEALAEVVAAFSAGNGPVAIDAERASGYRYTQRAYLVQLRRAGVGTVLIDPLPFEDLTTLNTAIQSTEWVVHAASQDLPSLAALGLRPHRIFDTELAGRLAGFDRVGLASMVARLLGVHLEKGHAAVDWSTRPLPADWLSYAALDVELLLELRVALIEELSQQGKFDWADEEFEAVALAPLPGPRAEPWRRTSGIHRVRTARGLARVRALWEARDRIAERRDIAPGRVLPDAAIVAGAQNDPTDERELLSIPLFTGRGPRRLTAVWLDALRQARTLSDDELPGATVSAEGPPPAHRWADRDPAAAQRLVDVRQVLSALAAEHHLPAENLLAPDVVRKFAWAPPKPADSEQIREALRALGARRWQIELTAPALTETLGS